jgi:hypothetical protein
MYIHVCAFVFIMNKTLQDIRLFIGFNRKNTLKAETETVFCI